MLKLCISSALQISVFSTLIAAANSPVWAQPISFGIEGKLVSPPGELPCSFCQVQLEDQLGGTGMVLSSGSGEFHFRNLSQDFYRIRVNNSGFEEVWMPVKLFSANTSIVIDMKPRKAQQSPATTGGQIVNLHTALEFQSRDVVELYKKAQKNRLSYKFAKAVPQYESITRTAPQLYVAHLELGLSYQALERLDEAEREFQTARELDPESADPLIHLGEIYILRGYWGLAADVSVQAIRQDPDNAQPYLNIGLALYCNGNLDLAKASLERAATLNSKLDEASLLLVNIYLNTHEESRALEQINMYFSKSSPRSRPPELSALRSQLRDGALQEYKVEIPVPLRIGSTVKKNACGN